jgi:hypothetical protein
MISDNLHARLTILVKVKFTQVQYKFFFETINSKMEKAHKLE